MTKGITPKQARDSQAKGETIPAFVLDVVDDLIKKEYRPHGFTLLFDDIVTELLKNRQVTSRSELPADWLKWMDFEPIYRSRGWKVKFEKPGYSESGRQMYHFSEI